MLYCNKKHETQERVINGTAQHYIILGENRKIDSIRTRELRIHCPKKLAIEAGKYPKLFIGTSRSGSPKLTSIPQERDYLLIDTDITLYFSAGIDHRLDNQDDSELTMYPKNGNVSIIPIDSMNLATLPKIMQQGSIHTQTGVNNSYLIEWKKDFLYVVNYSPTYTTYIFNDGTDDVIREMTFTQMVQYHEDGFIGDKHLSKWIELTLDENLRKLAKVGKLL